MQLQNKKTKNNRYNTKAKANSEICDGKTDGISLFILCSRFSSFVPI